MVSSPHEAMHRIFQEDPGIFARTFKRLGIPFVDPVSVSFLPTDLTEIKPLERRLDTLLEVKTAEGASYLLAIEAQGKKDPDKHGSWAYYLAYLYAKYRKPPLLLVVCQDEGTARWAETPFHVGTPHWRTLTVRPLVLGPHNTPAITDPAAAAEDLALAAFSAITHGKRPDAPMILEALAVALKTADNDTISIFYELTELGLGNKSARQMWRDLMAVHTSYFRSETSEMLREEGRAQGEAKSVLLVLQGRGVEVGEAVRERVTQCQDLDTLGAWLLRALTVERAEDIFL